MLSFSFSLPLFSITPLFSRFDIFATHRRSASRLLLQSSG
jgi:hypothetical protein